MLVPGIGIILLLFGLLLSALFSGSETGFYRAPRIRLELDAQAGRPRSRGLLWLSNHPSVFVATTLIGNNLANYMTSMAVVLLAASVVQAESSLLGDLLGPMLLTPILFVYGELMPKQLFLAAPYRLLRSVSPVFFVFVVLFAPFSVMLYGLNRLTSRFLGEAHDRVRPRLAKESLCRILDEGREAGLLSHSQRSLAQGLFAVTDVPLGRFTIPIESLPSVYESDAKNDVLAMAKRLNLAHLPVVRPGGVKFVGYARVADLFLSRESDWKTRPLLEVADSESPLNALLAMEEQDSVLAVVVRPGVGAIGWVEADAIRHAMFHAADDAAVC